MGGGGVGCSARLAVCTRCSLPHKQILRVDESREVLCATPPGFHLTNQMVSPPFIKLTVKQLTACELLE